MSAGAPVLASDLAGVLAGCWTAARPGRCSPTGTPTTWPGTCSRCWRDPVRRAELAAPRPQARRPFDWSVVAAEIMAVYETVTSGAPRVSTTAEPTSMWHRLVRGGRTAGGS